MPPDYLHEKFVQPKGLVDCTVHQVRLILQAGLVRRQ